MENKKQIIEGKPHQVTIDNRKRIMLSGILEVVSSQDKAVVCKIAGKVVYIFGKELRVSKLSLEEGTLIVDGEIDGLSYKDAQSSKSFFKRIFK